MLIYQRPPMDLRHLVPVEILQTLFDAMREVTEYRGETTVLYDNPAASGATDKELLSHL